MRINGNWIVTAALVFAPLLVQASPTQTPLSPLENKVRHELVTLPYLNVFDDVSFRVEGNTVTLLGQVTQPILKSDAESAVKHIEGVKRVENQIEVLPLSPFDNQIRLREYRAIFGFAPLQRYGMGVLPSVRIVVKNGHVTLTGVVSSEADRNMAYIRANSVSGVFSVDNQLRVEKS
jgi:hyperosmotically inducible protein